MIPTGSGAPIHLPEITGFADRDYGRSLLAEISAIHCAGDDCTGLIDRLLVGITRE